MVVYNGAMGHVRLQSNYAHAADVLGYIAAAQATDTCALVIITGTEGGGARAPGALMAVARSGESAGYVSNGCVDAAVILNAQEALETGQSVQIRYGKGSPFLDIKLPCGGRLDLLIIPHPNPEIIAEACETLNRRDQISLLFGRDGSVGLSKKDHSGTGLRDDVFQASYRPKPKLRIVGRGTEPLALARLALASDMEVLLQSPDDALVARAAALGAEAERIQPGQSLTAHDGAFTACILMFHDHDLEYDILIEALKTKAFYIGALGSQKTHDARCAGLRQGGVSEADIRKIKAPIGLIPSTRDASMLAISTLAEVAAAFQEASA